MIILVVMPRCACASEVYGSQFCECVYVSVLLVSHKLLKTKRWYVELKCKSTISQFLIGRIVKKWLCFCDVLDLLTQVAHWWRSRFLQGYPVYSRLISTLLYHERDGDAQDILLALLSKLSLL